MKKLELKSVLFGFTIGVIIVTTVFVSLGIKSAVPSNAKVTVDGIPMTLENSMVSISLNDTDDSKIYMQAREMLEYLGYTVSWNSEEKIFNLISGFGNSNSFILSDGAPDIYPNETPGEAFLSVAFIQENAVVAYLEETGEEIRLEFSIGIQNASDEVIINENTQIIKDVITKNLQSVDYESIDDNSKFVEEFEELLVEEINSALNREIAKQVFIFIYVVNYDVPLFIR